MSESLSTRLRASVSRPAVRAVVLGAVALATAGGLAHEGAFSPVTAQAQSAAAFQNNPNSFADVVDKVRGAVVSVKVKVTEASDEQAEPNIPQLRPGDPLERFFRRFGGENSPFPRQQRPRSGQAQGSGFIISADGYVVTNNHVIDKATEVSLTMDDGRTLSADVVGSDPRTDLALLKIKDGGNYPFVSFSGGTPRVGDWVIAVGNPFGLGGTVTSGIISARGRDIGAGPYDDFLQIDASVNRGNSGGPTFNLQGEVVGVNTAIFSPSGGSVGIGFAIPSEVARGVIDSLRQNGSVARGWIGVQIQPVTREIADSLGVKTTDGALVADLQAGSPAGAAGIRSGDIIVAVEGQRVETPRELARKIAAFGPEKRVQITYLRGGSERKTEVRLGNLPNEQQQRADRAPTQSERNAFSGLGLTLAPGGANGEGVVVAEVEPDSVAAQKGLKQGDVIVEAAGQPVSRPGDVSAALATAKKDGRKALLLRVRTGDATRFVALATTG
ncbi:MAG: Do family serine endopeptidase [Beijerinckiaceae bacterium]|jgi:serine protease Do|nr:Do family serine endopeptidase [Beijerinckiaceae bacterium]